MKALILLIYLYTGMQTGASKILGMKKIPGVPAESVFFLQFLGISHSGLVMNYYKEAIFYSFRALA